MLTFETINELTLKVTCTGNDVLFVKAGAFIAGDNVTVIIQPSERQGGEFA